MPNSRNRPKHRHHPQPHHRVEKTRNAKLILAIFGGLIGIAVGFFGGGSETLYLVAGAIIGAVTGFFIGRGMDKVADKENL